MGPSYFAITDVPPLDIEVFLNNMLNLFSFPIGSQFFLSGYFDAPTW